MDKTIAGLFAEGSSYLLKAWTRAIGISNQQDTPQSPELGECCVNTKLKKKDRSFSRDSGMSIASMNSVSMISDSANRLSSYSSAKKVAQMVSWLVFGGRRVVQGSRNKDSAMHSLLIPAPKKSALDIVLASDIPPLEPVHPANLKAVSVVGRGGYGKVILMKDHIDGRLVAVKEVAKSNLVEKPKSFKTAGKTIRPVSTKIEHAEMERMVLSVVSEHPFITSFHGSFQNQNKIFLFTQYASGGELFSLMQRQGIFSVDRVKLYAAEIISALEFLHANAIVYRDLKPENILLNREGHILLADFGLSISFDSPSDDTQMRCYSICGTPDYISPEIVLGATRCRYDRTWSYGKTVDWWALGVLTYEMLYRLPPFYDRERKVMLEKILKCNIHFPDRKRDKHKRLHRANDFISGLLKYHEHERLGYGNGGSARVKAHPFFSNLDWAKVDSCAYQPEFIPDLKDNLDTSCFDPSFTKEFLHEDKCRECSYNIVLTGYEDLQDGFEESLWYCKSARLSTT